MRRFVSTGVVAAAIALTGCTTVPPVQRSIDPNQSEWQGRLAVQVESEPPSAMSASFALRGVPQQGELDLYSPLGTTLGALQWSPHSVVLIQDGKPQTYYSLAELTQKTTGAALPLEALFNWLKGIEQEVPGWQVDLSTLPQGWLTAKRLVPAPQVTLRIKLD